MSSIAELFGRKCTGLTPTFDGKFHCRFMNAPCDVTSNRGRQAFLNLAEHAKHGPDKEDLEKKFSSPIPLGICSVSTKRQNEDTEKPWIICPKRLLDLKSCDAKLPPTVYKLFSESYKPGDLIKCFWEVKFRRRSGDDNAAESSAKDDDDSDDFFEFTFDFLLVPYTIDETYTQNKSHHVLSGVPNIIEIMTSSTRGGGLSEHMVDVLLQRPQRQLTKEVIKSKYTPNYRQVFERMLGQFFAKSEAAEAWGGKTVWLLQDVLLDYIEQTTAFRSAPFENSKDGNVFVEVFHLLSSKDSSRFDLAHQRSLRGHSRLSQRAGKRSSVDHTDGTFDFTGMLGAGYVPTKDQLIEFLQSNVNRSENKPKNATKNWIDLKWGPELIDGQLASC